MREASEVVGVVGVVPLRPPSLSPEDDDDDATTGLAIVPWVVVLRCCDSDGGGCPPRCNIFFCFLLLFLFCEFFFLEGGEITHTHTRTARKKKKMTTTIIHVSAIPTDWEEKFASDTNACLLIKWGFGLTYVELVTVLCMPESMCAEDLQKETNYVDTFQVQHASLLDEIRACRVDEEGGETRLLAKFPADDDNGQRAILHMWIALAAAYPRILYNRVNTMVTLHRAFSDDGVVPPNILSLHAALVSGGTEEEEVVDLGDDDGSGGGVSGDRDEEEDPIIDDDDDDDDDCGVCYLESGCSQHRKRVLADKMK